MDTLIGATLDELDLTDAVRGVWDVMATELMSVLRGAPVARLRGQAEGVARGLALSRGATCAELLRGSAIGCKAIEAAMRSRGERHLEVLADRMAGLQPFLQSSLAAGYAAGLEETVRRLERQAGGSSPIDPLSGVMKPEEIAERLALEVLRCRRMDLSLGVVGMALEIKGGEDLACRREDLVCVQRQAGACLRDSLRRYDGIGLLGAGGFLLILPDASRRGLAAAAERLRREVADRVGGERRLVLSLAQYDYVDIRPADVMAALQRDLLEAMDQGASLSWAA